MNLFRRESSTALWMQVGLASTYLLAIVIIFIWLADPAAPLTWLAMPIFYAWVTAPVLVTLVICMSVGSRIASVIATLVLAISVGSGLYVLLSGLFGPNTRSTSPLILLFWPLYQWVGVVVALLLLGGDKLAARRR